MAPPSEHSVHSCRKRWTERPWTPYLLLAAAFVSACTQPSKCPIERAEFGVLFGGQVQERNEIPFELDVSKQALGFVIALEHPLPKTTTLHWELSKPGPLSASRVPDPINRRIELFDAPVAAGQTQIQKTVKLEPGDGLGLWNLRVTLGDQLAIDRSFMVVEPGPRTRKVRKPVASDAGL